MTERSKQHFITDETQITETMTRDAMGTSWALYVGKTLDLAYEIPDSDSEDVLLRFTDGTVLLLFVDIGYTDDLVGRDPSRHEVFVADATETEAGKHVRRLDPGHWL